MCMTHSSSNLMCGFLVAKRCLPGCQPLPSTLILEFTPLASVKKNLLQIRKLSTELRSVGKIITCQFFRRSWTYKIDTYYIWHFFSRGYMWNFLFVDRSWVFLTFSCQTNRLLTLETEINAHKMVFQTTNRQPLRGRTYNIYYVGGGRLHSLSPTSTTQFNFLCQQALRSWKIRSYLTNVHDNLMLGWVKFEVTLVCQTSQRSLEALVMIVLEATFLSIVRVHLELFYDGVDCSTETPSPAGLSENPCESIDSALW